MHADIVLHNPTPPKQRLAKPPLLPASNPSSSRLSLLSTRIFSKSSLLQISGAGKSREQSHTSYELYKFHTVHEGVLKRNMGSEWSIFLELGRVSSSVANIDDAFALQHTHRLLSRARMWASEYVSE